MSTSAVVSPCASTLPMLTLWYSSQNPENRASGNSDWNPGLVSAWAAGRSSGTRAKNVVTACTGSAAAGSVPAGGLLVPPPAASSVLPLSCSPVGDGSGVVDGAAELVGAGDSWASDPPSPPNGSVSRNTTSPASRTATRPAAIQAPRPRFSRGGPGVAG